MSAPSIPSAPRRFRTRAGTTWVYLWSWPLRITHWISAVAITVLVTTGFYIGKPYFLTTGEASQHFMMGTFRLLHFVGAGWLVAAAILRIYWLFKGNRFEHWRALFPHRKIDFQRLMQQFKAYLLIKPEDAPLYLGHNPLQQVTYTALYAITVWMFISGFAMYGEHDPQGLFHALFTSWLAPLLGGIQRVRFLHHVTTWLFVIFVPVHVYLAMRMDLLEETGTISSIVSGGRLVRSDKTYADAEEEN